MARSSTRVEVQIEQADTALRAVAANLLDSSNAQFVCVVTPDLDAGNGVVAALGATASKTAFSSRMDLINEIT